MRIKMDTVLPRMPKHDMKNCSTPSRKKLSKVRLVRSSNDAGGHKRERLDWVDSYWSRRERLMELLILVWLSSSHIVENLKLIRSFIYIAETTGNLISYFYLYNLYTVERKRNKLGDDCQDPWARLGNEIDPPKTLSFSTI